VVSDLVYYAMGGGLGHVVRAGAFLHTIGYRGRATLVTASELAKDTRVVGGLDVLQVPAELERDAPAFRQWLGQQITRLGADCLCVDTFPAGILGELEPPMPSDLAFWHVARLLRWREYAPLLRGAPIMFDRCWCVEPLEAEHRAFLATCCERVENLELCDPPQPHTARAEVAEAEPYWLVVHSGPEAEVTELLAYASEIRRLEQARVTLLLITRSAPRDLPADTRPLDALPAEPYFANALRIFMAAGFNSMRQTERYASKRTLLPMPRRFDDQFERARRARSSGAPRR
jgi:hypothetical protein